MYQPGQKIRVIPLGPVPEGYKGAAWMDYVPAWLPDVYLISLHPFQYRWPRLWLAGIYPRMDESEPEGLTTFWVHEEQMVPCLPPVFIDLNMVMDHYV
jgi:hypothetical protein